MGTIKNKWNLKELIKDGFAKKVSDATGNDGLLGIITTGEKCIESGIMLRYLYNKKFEYFISVYFDKNKFNKEKMGEK